MTVKDCARLSQLLRIYGSRTAPLDCGPPPQHFRALTSMRYQHKREPLTRATARITDGDTMINSSCLRLDRARRRLHQR